MAQPSLSRPREELTDLAAAHRVAGQLETACGQVARQAEARAAHTRLGYPTMEAAVSQLLTIPRQRAQAMLIRAERLAGSPLALQAALDGKLNSAQAEAAAEAFDQVREHVPESGRAQVEATLVAQAGRSALPRAGKLAQHALSQVAPESSEALADQRAARLERQREIAYLNRSLTLRSDRAGSIIFHGSLPLAEGRELEALLEPQMAQLAKNAADAADHPYGVGRDFNRAALRVDALMRALRHDRACDRRARASQPPRLSVTVSLDQLRRGLAGGSVVSDPSQEALAPSDLRRMACDAGVIPAVLGGASAVVDLGRESRLVEAPLRRALDLRDGGCVFPNCFEPPHRCHAHHIVPWFLGGATDLGNLAYVCAHHHGIVEPSRELTHDGKIKVDPSRWRVEIGPEGFPVTIPPIEVDPRQTPIIHERLRARLAAARAAGRGTAPPGEASPPGNASPPGQPRGTAPPGSTGAVPDP
ncbi:MAG: HNH endonuclease [Bifidobacteriaceae bacterium]|nr:HNH endonuclease [Bifidobacteriaceae bacterium]